MSGNFLHVEGTKIVDANGNEVRLTGINWFGMETETYVPHGIWQRNWEDMLDQVAYMGFNSLRLPYSNELLDWNGRCPASIDYYLNDDLRGLDALNIMDLIVKGAKDRGLKVILDRHQPEHLHEKEERPDLWHTDRYPEERWINDWKMLAGRYKDNDTVIGADVHNEPYGRSTWGTGDPNTDWRLAAERIGNAILAVNPDWLIFVEGIENYNGDWYWRGGNLKGVRDHPVRLDDPKKLVYSAHDYGPGVWPQPWFTEGDFPENLRREGGVWDAHWGYIQREGIAPVLIGEFGGRSVGKDTEGVWQNTLVQYLKDHGIHYTYWCLNQDSTDTGGMLKDDWMSVERGKLNLLRRYQWPLLDKPRMAPD